ncbi:MAG TPA: hypothetical protein VK474_05550 [Chthoniobacterales bacterium]|nr:hypothetical protein [Chthoniobacterales bacterium]
MPKAKAKSATATANMHAVVGSDESEVKRVAAELAAKLTPLDAGDFGLEVIRCHRQILADSRPGC